MQSTPTPEEVEQVTRALMEALEHLETSFNDLRNGYPENELHEHPEATDFRTKEALSPESPRSPGVQAGEVEGRPRSGRCL